MCFPPFLLHLFLLFSFRCLLVSGTLVLSCEVTAKHFQICMKDWAGYDSQRSDVSIDYLVIGGKYENYFMFSLTSTPYC